jgi:hypothetical protein
MSGCSVGLLHSPFSVHNAQYLFFSTFTNNLKLD